MQLARKRLIHISQCRGVTRRIVRKMIKEDSTLRIVYEQSPELLSSSFSISLDHARLFYQDLHNNDFMKHVKKQLKSYHIVTIFDPIYPQLLKSIPDAPLVFYAIGKLSLLQHNPKISVIGTRNPTTEAMPKMKVVLKSLINNNFIIVSGMARGIDRYAHQLALQYNGWTIAVLGGGFQHIYPKEHSTLFRQIAQKGLVISEYAPYEQPKKYYFPERNRIISGLSFGTLVVEAKKRSGTLITVNHALDQGREVYAIPGSPLKLESRGCHELIQDGAKLVIDADDILEDWFKWAEWLKTN